MFVWGGHPASTAYPDKDRRPGLQLEVFASAKSNIIHFSERAGPSLSHLDMKEGGGEWKVERRITAIVSEKENVTKLHPHVMLKGLLLPPGMKPAVFKPWIDFCT